MKKLKLVIIAIVIIAIAISIYAISQNATALRCYWDAPTPRAH